MNYDQRNRAIELLDLLVNSRDLYFNNVVASDCRALLAELKQPPSNVVIRCQHCHREIFDSMSDRHKKAMTVYEAHQAVCSDCCLEHMGGLVS